MHSFVVIGGKSRREHLVAVLRSESQAIMSRSTGRAWPWDAIFQSISCRARLGVAARHGGVGVLRQIDRPRLPANQKEETGNAQAPHPRISWSAPVGCRARPFAEGSAQGSRLCADIGPLAGHGSRRCGYMQAATARRDHKLGILTTIPGRPQDARRWVSKIQRKPVTRARVRDEFPAQGKRTDPDRHRAGYRRNHARMRVKLKSTFRRAG